MTILKSLDHPHIIKIFEMFQDKKNYYFVQEYLKGGDLFKKLTVLPNFSEKLAADYMK